jgi:hypothetical protein
MFAIIYKYRHVDKRLLDQDYGFCLGPCIVKTARSMECGFQMTEISFYDLFSFVAQNMI